MTEGGHNGAWYCSQTKTKEICPQQGCPKGWCERAAGWLPGMPEPDHYTRPPATQGVWSKKVSLASSAYPPATQADDADLLDEIAEAISDTLDMDWQPSWAAPNILALINRETAKAFERGLATGKSDAKGNYDAAHAAGRAEERADVEPLFVLLSRVKAYEHMFGRAVAAFGMFADLAKKGPLYNLAKNAEDQALRDLDAIKQQAQWLSERGFSAIERGQDGSKGDE